MEDNIEVKKGRKGRPAGRPTGSNTTVIEDEMLSPYKIYIDTDQYSVVSAESKNDTEKSFGFFTSLSSALNKIIRMQLVNNKKYTLPGYIYEYEKKMKEFQEKFKF